MSNQSEPTSKAVTEPESECSIEKNVSHLMRQLDGIKIWDTKPELAKLKLSLSDFQKMQENKAVATDAFATEGKKLSVDGKTSGSYADAVRRNIKDQSRDYPDSATKTDSSSQQTRPTLSSDTKDSLPLGSKTPVKTEDGMKKATGDQSDTTVCATSASVPSTGTQPPRFSDTKDSLPLGGKTHEDGRKKATGDQSNTPVSGTSVSVLSTGTQPASSSIPKLSTDIETAKDGNSVRSPLKPKVKRSRSRSSETRKQKGPMATVVGQKTEPAIRSASRSRTRSRSGEKRKQKGPTVNVVGKKTESVIRSSSRSPCRTSSRSAETRKQKGPMATVVGKKTEPAIRSASRSRTRSRSAETRSQKEPTVNVVGKKTEPVIRSSSRSPCRTSSQSAEIRKQKGPMATVVGKKTEPVIRSSSRSPCRTSSRSAETRKQKAMVTAVEQKTEPATRSSSRSPLKPEVNITRSRSGEKRKQKGPVATEMLSASSGGLMSQTEFDLAKANNNSSKGISTGMSARRSRSSSRSNEATATQGVPNPTAQKSSAKARTPKKEVSTPNAGSASPNRSYDKRGKQETNTPIAVNSPTPILSPLRKITTNEKHIALDKGDARTKSPGSSKPILSGEKPKSRARSKVRVPSLTPPGNVKTTAKFYEEITRAVRISQEKSPQMKLQKGTGSSDNRPCSSNDDPNLTTPAKSSLKPDNSPLSEAILRRLRRSPVPDRPISIEKSPVSKANLKGVCRSPIPDRPRPSNNDPNPTTPARSSLKPENSSLSDAILKGVRRSPVPDRPKSTEKAPVNETILKEVSRTPADPDTSLSADWIGLD